MKKILLLLAVVFALTACEKNEDGLKNSLQLSLKSCVLDNEHSYTEVKKLSGTGSLSVTSSNPDVAEILYDEENKNVFYIIGYGQGISTITVVDAFNQKDDYDAQTIDVVVRESIDYGDYSYQEVFMKKGDFRIFKLPFIFDKNDSLVGVNDYIVSMSANVALGNQFKVQAISTGNTKFQIFKGKIELFSVYINVVNEYDLFIPESENSQLTFDLPFTVGVNGISVWRGSGHYTAKVVDETVAVVKSITPGNDHFNQESNSAVVWVTPLKSGKTKLIVTDAVTGQTSGVDVVVN
ncbi:MAG: hypothetical protein M0R23_09045 [Bacteroidales bacterium]|nr:hypothetical protein [Bacteroidales bacterium]